MNPQQFQQPQQPQQFQQQPQQQVQQPQRPQQRQPSRWRHHLSNLVKAGPAIGATAGAAVGLLARKRMPGGFVKRMVEGAGIGSLAGWAPGFYSDAAAAARNSRAFEARRSNALQKVASKLTQGRESSAAYDFAAGLDPTGSMTFKSGLVNRKNHAKHVATGLAGGMLAGATVIPSAIYAGIGLASGRGGAAGRLRNAYQQALRPIREPLRGWRTSRALGKIQRSGGTHTLSQGQRKLLGEVASERASQSGATSEIAQQAMAKVRQGLAPGKRMNSRELAQVAAQRKAAQKKTREGVAVLAAGGGINAGSAAYQYGQAQQMQGVLDAEAAARRKAAARAAKLRGQSGT